MLVTSIARTSARLSLVIGTILFLAAKLTNAEIFFIVGLIYVLIALAVNGIILFVLLLHLITIRTHHQSELIKTALLLIVNIPIAMFYFWILML